MTQDLKDAFHARIKNLTGEAWIPYTHNYHAEIMEHSTDDELIEFVTERRRHMFPDFIGKEPQAIFLNKMIKKYAINDPGFNEDGNF